LKSKLFKISTRLGKVFAALAMAVTISNVNSTCVFISHQPEMPAESKKLRKF
jgi:cyclic lactone autoinducer peptide